MKKYLHVRMETKYGTDQLDIGARGEWVLLFVFGTWEFFRNYIIAISSGKSLIHEKMTWIILSQIGPNANWDKFWRLRSQTSKLPFAYMFLESQSHDCYIIEIEKLTSVIRQISYIIHAKHWNEWLITEIIQMNYLIVYTFRSIWQLSLSICYVKSIFFF